MHNFTYNEQERRKRQTPERILHAIGLKAGMVLMDIGCNDGFFTIPAARIVGDRGKVYGVDINTIAIKRLKKKAELAGLTNIEVKGGEAEKTLFCTNCADIIFYGTVLHNFQDPLEVLRKAEQMIRPGGKIVNFDWKKKETKIGPPLTKRLNEIQASDLLKKAGFRITEIKDTSENFYQITAVK